MKLSVVYSFYNEQENIPELIRRTRDTLQNKLKFALGEYEMVFVNDNSKDSSVEILQKEALKVPDIKIVNMSRNFGNAQCILAGFAHAQGERIAYLDSDLQDPPELMEQMYKAAVERGVDIVHTKRTKRMGESAIKLFITKIGYAILGYSMTVDLQPNVGDYKMISRRVADAVLRLEEPLPFMRGLISYVGYKATTIEYIRDPRFDGETHFPVFGKKVILNFLNSAFIGFSDLPIYIIIYLSVGGLMLAAALSVYVLYLKFTGLSVPGSAGVILAITLFSSLIIFSLGILGLYLASIKRAVLRRPLYLVDQVLDYTKKN